MCSEHIGTQLELCRDMSSHTSQASGEQACAACEIKTEPRACFASTRVSDVFKHIWKYSSIIVDLCRRSSAPDQVCNGYICVASHSRTQESS